MAGSEMDKPFPGEPVDEARYGLRRGSQQCREVLSLDRQLDTVAPFIKGSAVAFVKHKQQVKQSASQSARQKRGAIRLGSVEIAESLLHEAFHKIGIVFEHPAQMRRLQEAYSASR